MQRVNNANKNAFCFEGSQLLYINGINESYSNAAHRKLLMRNELETTY